MPLHDLTRDCVPYGADESDENSAFDESMTSRPLAETMDEGKFTVPALLEEAQRLQQELREERDRLRLLLDVNNLLVSRLDYPELLRTLSLSIHRVVKHDSASVALFDRTTRRLKLQALTYTTGPEV